LKSPTRCLLTKGEKLVTLNRFRLKHWASSTPPMIGIGHEREQFAFLEQIEEAKAAGL
jgi:hypothetical protein